MGMYTPSMRRDWGLFCVGVLSLFLELLLIRWIGTEVRIFSYLQNTVLVVCFLGLGMGCFTSGKPAPLIKTLVPLSILVLILTVPGLREGFANISEQLSVLDDFLIWYENADRTIGTSAAMVRTGLALTFIIMLVLWFIFLPLGRILGALMLDHPQPVRAYSANVIGSLIGIWLFVLLCGIAQPPVVWFLAMALVAMTLLSTKGTTRLMELGILAGIVVLVFFGSHRTGDREVFWSPYQKLVLRDDSTGDLLINVNNVGYQKMLDLSVENVAAHPRRFDKDLRGLSQYDLPALFHSAPTSMLIVGAGSGNDAAGALRQGLAEVTAVEIDPVIVDLGRRYHPEKPYDQPQVRVVKDDARSFFARTSERFDVISFGLLDSHTTTAMTNARLDHYVYTLESIRRAKDLLTEDGVMVLTFDARRVYIADRMARVLRDVFGEPPIVIPVPTTHYGWGGIMFVAGNTQAIYGRIKENEPLADLIAQWQASAPISLTYTTPLATDDWPYIYLERPMIPALFVLLAALMSLLFVCGRSFAGIRWQSLQWKSSHWHFFFLGAAFLLLEVQNISKASVALGNTWQVNAVIISAVLLMVLLANAVAARFTHLPLLGVYFCLLVTCLGLYFVDLSFFSHLVYPAKCLIVGALTTLPMFFGGLIFIRSFVNVQHRDEALGANLLGALVGALLQSLTFLMGIKFLLLIVAGAYAGAFLTGGRGSSQKNVTLP
ncbi:MAG: hypothetical protein GY906_18265 [bacterium]|nr:hypothetical protein [bacterium]